jgi:hypothetical protein
MAKRGKKRTSAAASRPRRAAPRRLRKPRGSDPEKRDAALLARELDDARQQQAATAEVLRVISNSPTDVQSVLGAIAESAARLLDVTDAEIMRVEGDMLRLVANHGAFRQWPVGSVRPISPNWVSGRAVLDCRTIHVPDLQAAASEFPEGADSARQLGHRTTLPHPCCGRDARCGQF